MLRIEYWRFNMSVYCNEEQTCLLFYTRTGKKICSSLPKTTRKLSLYKCTNICATDKENTKVGTLPSLRSVSLFQWLKSAFVSSHVSKKSWTDQPILSSLHKAISLTNYHYIRQSSVDSESRWYLHLFNFKWTYLPASLQESAKPVCSSFNTIPCLFFFFCFWLWMRLSPLKQKIRASKQPTVKFTPAFRFHHGANEMLYLLECGTA
jgi:hypothetical protein